MNQFVDNDSMTVTITIHKNGTIEYNISIYKLKPKELCHNNRLRFYKGNMDNCNWNYIIYQYTRI